MPEASTLGGTQVTSVKTAYPHAKISAVSELTGNKPNLSAVAQTTWPAKAARWPNATYPNVRLYAS